MAIFAIKSVLVYKISNFFFIETQSSCSNWYLSEFATLYVMAKGPKNGFKKPKNEEISQIS